MRYYVNRFAQDNSVHEVHEMTCPFMPTPVSCLYLGDFSSCGGAVAEAKKSYVQSDGCFYCSPACHAS